MKFIYTLLAIMIVIQSHAQTIYVRSGGNGTGTSWADAQGNLKAALDQATNGTQVWIAAGTYTPHATDRSISFVLKNGVSVLGGFPATGTPTINDRNPANFPTVLSGDIGMVNNINDNSYSVVTAINVGNARLDGLVIFNGHASENNTNEIITSYAGGGVFLSANDGMSHTPTIENCMFSNNTANTGAAVFVLGTNNTSINPIFKRCTFTNNMGVFGGAVHNEANGNGSNEVQFEDCIFQNNEATETGGAVNNIADGGDLNINISRSAFYNNTSPVGGAVFNFPNNGTIAAQVNNAIFYGNQAESGGAIDNFGFDTDQVNLLLRNCTFTENIADLGGALSTFGGGVTIQSTNCIFWNNQATGEGITASNFVGGVTNFSYCLIQENSCNEGGFVGTCDHSVFALDPLFINPDNFNFLLAPCSPVLDAGINVGISAFDFAGNNRNFGGTVDLGALEWNGSPGILTVTSAPIDISCHGETDGRIDLEITGGVPPYTFPNVLENLSAGTYLVEIVDAVGCTTSTSATINEPTAISSTANVVSGLSCFSVSDGQANMIVMGGTLPYAYQWDNGENTAQAMNLSAGMHTATATDVNGCETTSTVDLTAPPQLSATTSIVTQITCGEDGNGTAIVNASGGVPGYTYLWDNGNTTVDASNLSVGQHCVTVTDFNNCTTVSCVTLQGSEELTIIPTITQELLCNGDTNGAATVSIEGGIPPYAYLWGNGSMTAATNNLVAGNHTVTITDSNDCTAAMTITLTQPTALNLSLDLQNMIVCAGAADGQLSASVSGGVEPYIYTWSNGQTNSTITNLVAGEYCLTVTDANDCTMVNCMTLDQPTEITSEVMITQDILCFGDENGEATVIASGGTPPYSYTWSSETIGTNLGAGTYQITINDVNGCEHFASFTLAQPDELSVTIENITHISETGVNDGSIEIAVNGGTGTYTYAWDHGIGNVQNPTGLSPAIYTVIVTDENGCSTMATATIADPNMVTITTINTSDVTCHDGMDGGIQVTIAGGVEPYVFAWDNGLGGIQNPTNLTAGTYSVTVTDAVGMTATASATIAEPSAIEITNISIDGVTCDGSSTGSLTVSVTGGVPPYLYDWGNGIQESPTTDVLASDNYQVTVYDDNDCTLVSDPILINLEAMINIESNVTSPSCAGDSDGRISLNVSGGTSPYTYEWADETIGNIPNPAGLVAGNYEVIITDVNGCSVVETIVLPQTPELSAVLISTPDDGTNNGTATVTGEGGTPPYTYNWVDANMQNTPTITGLAAGTYVVIVTDANGCDLTTTIEVMLVSATSELEALENLDIFPNPTTGKLTIRMSLSETAYTQISIVDALGRVVLTRPVEKAKTPDYQLDLSSLASGMYLVKIALDDTVLGRRVVVE